MKVPNNLEEAIDQLYGEMSDIDKACMMKKDPDWFCGMSIRNGFKLWEKGTPLHEWFRTIGIFHADDASAIIIDAVVSRVRENKFELSEQVKYYQDYWDNLPGTPEYAENQKVKFQAQCEIQCPTKIVKKPWWMIW